MTTPLAGDNPHDSFYRWVIAEVGGSYLRNTIREPGITCLVCTTPVEPPYSHCYRCNHDMQSASNHQQNLARLVLPLVYGVAGTQSGYLMRLYKGSGATQQQRFQLTLLLAVALTEHRKCIEARVGHEISAWTTIPSTKGRPGDHPIRSIAAQAQPAAIEVALAHGDPPTDDRAYSPGRWRVPAREIVAGRHVLVIDDTWTTGGRAQSAASALTAAGATAVSIIVLTLAGPLLRRHSQFRLHSPYLRLRPTEMPSHGMDVRVTGHVHGCIAGHRGCITDLSAADTDRSAAGAGRCRARRRTEGKVGPLASWVAGAVAGRGVEDGAVGVAGADGVGQGVVDFQDRFLGGLFRTMLLILRDVC